jgi:chloride channel protein, CIC family
VEIQARTDHEDRDVLVTLWDAGAIRFWVTIILTGIGTGIAAGLLAFALERIQSLSWDGIQGATLLDSTQHAGPWRHVIVLVSAGFLTGMGQWIPMFVAAGNGIEITAAIWFNAGRLPVIRTLGSAVLSIVLVGMGTSLGREGAPKQVGAVIANLLATGQRPSDEQRRLLVVWARAPAWPLPIACPSGALSLLLRYYAALYRSGS